MKCPLYSTATTRKKVWRHFFFITFRWIKCAPCECEQTLWIKINDGIFYVRTFLSITNNLCSRFFILFRTYMANTILIIAVYLYIIFIFFFSNKILGYSKINITQQSKKINKKNNSISRYNILYSIPDIEARSDLL